MESIEVRAARRLALSRAGLLKPEWTGFPRRAKGRGLRARKAACEVVRRFGYLQLDTVSIAGARSHGIVLHSRIDGLDASLAEELLRPDGTLFEYWGHLASWIPMELYPVFAFRRAAYVVHPWWGDILGEHPQMADHVLKRLRDEGPLRSVDFEGSNHGGWWNLKLANKVVTALWSAGEIAVRERRGFQRVYDLPERVIPDDVRGRSVPVEEAVETLLLIALRGHGWAMTGTLGRTWQFQKRGDQVRDALARLEDRGAIVACRLEDGPVGWIRTEDLELADRLRRVRPRDEDGVLLSPFDPVLWDRKRVDRLFGFDMVLEIFKPEADRIYGYYCLPVLAGESLVARVDLKADRKKGVVRVLSCRLEEGVGAVAREATRRALERYGTSVGLEPVGGPD